MYKNCVHLKEIMLMQRAIISRHIDEHKWFLHIIDQEDAMEDFLKKFAVFMREVYCGFNCADRFECEYAQTILPKKLQEDENICNAELELARYELIKRHLDNHKWFLHISDPKEAEDDFIKKFDWIIIEVICGFTCPMRQECKKAREFFFPQEKQA